MKAIILVFIISFSIIFKVKGQITYLGSCGTQNEIGLHMIISPDNNFVYVVTTNTIQTYQRDTSNGQLNFIASINQMTDGTQFYHIFNLTFSPDCKFIYVEGTHKAFVFQRDSITGLLTPFQTLSNNFGPTIYPISNNNIVCSKDKKNVYICGRENLFIFERNAITDSLSHINTMQDWSNGPYAGYMFDISITLSPDDRYAFVTALHSISMYSRDTTTGLLLFESVITGSNDVNRGLAYSNESKTSSDGRFLYTVSNAQAIGGLVVSSINYTTDSLTVVQTFFDNIYPTFVDISPDNKLLSISSGNFGINAISFYSLDSTTGLVKHVSSFSNLGMYNNKKCIDMKNNYMYSCSSFEDTIHIHKLSTNNLVENSSDLGFSVSPNPFSGPIIISNDNNNISNVKIFNLLGELVYESNYTTPLLEVTLNLEGLAKGLYLLQVVDGNQVVETKKILFQ